MWMKGKSGWTLSRLKRKFNLEDYAFHRTLADMQLERCPQTNWQGMDFQSIFDRVNAINAGRYPSDTNEDELKTIRNGFVWIKDEGDFMLQMLRSFDKDLTWSTVTANRDSKIVRELIMNPLLLPGFNDSGAHLTNMAFYDVNLRSLKLASQGGDRDVSFMVKRLTKDAADLFGVEGGTLDQGDVADLILINPEKLAQYDGEASTQRIYREEFRYEQLVNRSDGVVELVMIGGNIAWENNQFAHDLGQKSMGRLLRAGNKTE